MENKEWFAEWFDTPYYHILYKNRNTAEAEQFINHLIQFLHLNEKASVLDLACGKGRHSVTLSKYGFDVTGADLSSNSILEAKKSENDHLHFLVQDMREPINGKSFDAVFNLFTSFGYFDSIHDNERVIQAVNQMLTPEGWLIIDFMNAEKVIANLVSEEVKNVDNLSFQIRRNYDGQHIFKTISFEDKGVSHTYTERVQALKKADFEKLLTENGFEIVKIFGNFTLQPYEESTSDRLIITARKK